MSIIIILLAILAVFILWVVFTYNGFVRLVNRAKEAWADIDVQLKRRYNLIPNLVSTVKGYAAHEAKVFETVTNARTTAINVGNENTKKRGEAENMLTGALKSIFAVAEAYPALRADQNFLQLQRELADTENKIQAARRFYNTNVRDLNIKVDSFPDNVIANFFKFSKKEFFEIADEAAREPVSVKF